MIIITQKVFVEMVVKNSFTWKIEVHVYIYDRMGVRNNEGAKSKSFTRNVF